MEFREYTAYISFCPDQLNGRRVPGVPLSETREAPDVNESFDVVIEVINV